VRGENESFAAVSDLCQRVPQQAPCHWVNPSRRLVQKDDRRVADQSYASTQLPFVATTEYNQAISSAPRWVTFSVQDCEPRMRCASLQSTLSIRLLVLPIRRSAKVLSQDVVHKTGSTYRTITRPEEDRATAIGSMEDGACSSGDMLTFFQ